MSTGVNATNGVVKNSVLKNDVLKVGKYEIATSLATSSTGAEPGPAALLVHGWTSAQDLHDLADRGRLRPASP